MHGIVINVQKTIVMDISWEELLWLERWSLGNKVLKQGDDGGVP